MSIIIKDLSKNSTKNKLKIHKDMPRPPFTMALVGPSRSGKSNVVRNLMMRSDLMSRIFDYIFIFCPSIELNGDFDEIITNKNRVIHKFDSFSEQKIQQIMDLQKKVIKENGLNNSGRILILLDDCFDDIKFTNSKSLRTLCVRGRHMNISILMSGQKFSLMSTTCRNNMTHMALFRPGNYKELDSILEENIHKSKRKEFEKVFKDIWKKKYSFIFIDKLNEDLGKRFRKGFSEPIKITL